MDRAQLCPTFCDPMDPPSSAVHGISRLEHWSGLPFPTPGHLPDPGLEPADSWPLCHLGFVKQSHPSNRKTAKVFKEDFFSFLPLHVYLSSPSFTHHLLINKGPKICLVWLQQDRFSTINIRSHWKKKNTKCLPGLIWRHRYSLGSSIIEGLYGFFEKPLSLLLPTISFIILLMLVKNL